MKQHPVLTMIEKMTTTDQSDRLNLEDLIKSIDNAKLHESPFINMKIFDAIENHINDDLSENNANMQFEDYFKNLDNLS